MKKTFWFIGVIAIIASCTLMSFDEFHGQHAGANPEVKNYIKQNIMPVLHEKRLVLERELTPAEKAEVAECRTLLNQLHEQRRQMMEQRAEQKAEGTDNEAYNEGGHKNPAFAEAHQKMKEIMQRLQAIVDRHSNTLDDIKTQLEPQRKQWKDDLAKLQPDAKNNEAFMYSGYAPHFLEGYHNSRIRFLLMPVTRPTAESTPLEGSPNELKSDMTSETALPSASAAFVSGFNVFPNPANIEVITGSEVLPTDNLLTVYDAQGKSVMTLQNVQASQHIDISQLPVGTYILQIKGGDQTASQKIVVAR